MVEWTIKEGALDPAKEKITATIKAVTDNEPKMMAFHWYTNEDESKFYLLEWFAEAGAIVDHFENVGEALGEFFNYAEITRYEVFGDLSAPSEEIVNSLGANKFKHLTGFTRAEEDMLDQGDSIGGNQVQYIVEWTIKEGSLETAKKMAADVTKSVAANEPKMMAFQWYINEDQTKLYLVEWFADADAIVDHFENVGEALGEFFNYAEISRYEVFGDLTEEARRAVEGLGAQTFDHWDGFTR